MSVHDRWRWGAGALVLLAFALVSGSHLCSVALDKTASDPGMRPIGSGGLACAEFWLNRYQTLIAALVAGLIAFWAARLLFQQVGAQRFDFLARQIAELADIQDISRDIFIECTTNLSVDRAIAGWDEPKLPGMMGDWFETSSENFYANVDRARNKTDKLKRATTRPIGPSETAIRAKEFAASVFAYLFACEQDYHSGWSNLGMGIGGKISRRKVNRSDESRLKMWDMLTTYNALLDTYKIEDENLRRSQAQAHSAAH